MKDEKKIGVNAQEILIKELEKKVYMEREEENKKTVFPAIFSDISGYLFWIIIFIMFLLVIHIHR